jgi:HD superfamily phosphohydrolase
MNLSTGTKTELSFKAAPFQFADILNLETPGTYKGQDSGQLLQILQQPMEEILKNFTIETVRGFASEPHIQNLLSDIRSQRRADGSFNYSPIDYTDPIHRKTILPTELVAIINTPPLLRLAEVGQMTLMGHSRLAHSIGVAILALRFAEKRNLPPQEKKELATIALLHDVGHGPYSHLYEKLYIRNKQDRFDHDQHREKLINSIQLSNALKEIGVCPKMVVDALQDPSKNWMAYLAKEILDRVDYNSRDIFYSNCNDDYKSWIQAKSDALFKAIGYESGKIFFSAANSKTIERFMAARRLSFNSLPYDSDRRLAESLISSSIRTQLANVPEDVRPKVVEALSLFTDGQLNSLLGEKALKALNTAHATNSVPTLLKLATEDLANNCRGYKSIKPKEILQELSSLRTEHADITWLVSIIPACSPAMSFKIKHADEIKIIHKELPEREAKNPRQNGKQIGKICIAAYDQNGDFVPFSNDLNDAIINSFARKGWIYGREDEKVYTGWPGSFDHGSNFAFSEAPDGLEAEYHKLKHKPDRIETE